MKTLILVLILFLQSCSWFEKKPSGLISVSGTFTYEDFIVEKDSSYIVYGFKSVNERSFLGYFKNEDLIKKFFDNKKNIPFKGTFKGNVIYNQNNRIDYLKIEEMDDQSISLEIQGKDIN